MGDAKIIQMPTTARSEKERKLLDEIGSDFEIRDDGLRGRAKEYMNSHFALVSWYHLNGTRVSFEEADAAVRTRQSYNGKVPLPKIVGIKKYDDLR